MKAVCCDRCGKFERKVDARHLEGWHHLQAPGPSIQDPLGEHPDGLLLCPKCKLAFKEFMRQPGAVFVLENQ